MVLGKLVNDRYEVLEKIGEGGMAVVYRAQDTVLERTVAMKFLRIQYASDEDFVRRFRREAQAAARLGHPNIVNVYDVGEEEDTHYIVMENVEGQNLKEKLSGNQKLPLDRVLRWVREIAGALEHAHANNIIHCDIKPHNILITPDDRVKVTDFGIARAVTTSTATHTETVIGSAHYFSPEQAKGGLIGARSDLYALGVLFYEMVTGRLPFRGESPIVVALQHIQDSPTPPRELNPGLPEKVDEIIIQLLSKDPDNRYQSASELLDDLDQFDIVGEEESPAGEDEKEDDSSSTRVFDRPDEREELKKVRYGLRGWREEGEEASFEDEPEEQADSEAAPEEEGQEESGAESGRRFSKKAVLALIGAVVSVILLGFGLMTVPELLYVDDVEVPDLSGLSYEQARDTLGDLGLRLNVYHRTHSEEVPDEHVISQFPQSGNQVKQNRMVNVVISEGPKMVMVPDLEGRSEREARVQLERLGLKVGEIYRSYSEEAEPDRIIAQEPQEGTELAAGKAVDLTLSRGTIPSWVEVPDLVGKSIEEAERILGQVGLVPGEFEYQYSFNYPQDQIIKQKPPTGSEVLYESEVELLVSKGPIPDVEDRRRAELRVTIPPGGKPSQQVQVYVHDRYGERLLYEQIHKPGDDLTVDVISVGEALVRVYIEGNLLRQYQL